MAHEHDGWSSVPNWVIRSNELGGAEKLVYISLLNRANERGECWPSLSTLQRDSNASKNTVLKAIRSLEAKSLIRKTRRTRGDGRFTSVNDSNLYQILTRRGGSENEPGGSNEDQGVVQPLNQGGSNEDQEVLPIEVQPIRSTASREIEEKFEEAYAHWPKKVDRRNSLARFKQACKKLDPDELVAEIIRFGRAYAQTTQKRFVPALSVWLNGERWTDELPSAEKNLGTHQPSASWMERTQVPAWKRPPEESS